MSETIFALSSGRGPAGVAVVRVSGLRAGDAVTLLTGQPVPAPRMAALRLLHDPHDGEVIDQSLLLWFPAPNSFTGEDVAEFHVHGGPAVVSGVLTALGQQPGLRPAEPGEFTRRAFLAGKMDLTQVEGLADLINAETEAQRRQALRQMQGVLANLYEGWREQLVRALAYVEADIDFADEDDVPEHVSAQVKDAIERLSAEIASHLADGSRGERLRDGLGVAIIGKPNAGKSSLLNALAKREVAIVSNIAGTTRDVIEVHLNLGGYPVTLIDTAGLRETDDPVEAEGVARARARAQAADLRLHLTPYGEEPETTEGESLSVITKIDLGGGSPGHRDGRFYISVVTGAGLTELVAHLADWASKALGGGESVLLTRERHRHALEACRAHLHAALTQPDLVLMAEDMRLAARALGRITGRVDVEDLLDVIFRDFCIGK
ncbi:tRNA uridine-5-carboxymethylaminomethyl(34) synthesis GTPase MnmE [Pedomonas mirosovicensis]|uniref:tRNA uridine-5-carboxymethylaminomethyl(34) synthesis GTPase MnmE n=1 Tax=Pedomonas mirosovicensis TaxID=2908641 RepID=UPI00216A3BF9|nr:tRNA uridine-5-carboxymethylaminomethyl(34) synthesis GTPase MnmE [Pedomonas mirosovicensis]MCH8684110.1 tRNA uridine-5-carboxymethylaminomethyl(34) synthesis GTPase MnmE [Pedomonas mirosovicensis]